MTMLLEPHWSFRAFSALLQRRPITRLRRHLPSKLGFALQHASLRARPRGTRHFRNTVPTRVTAFSLVREPAASAWLVACSLLSVCVLCSTQCVDSACVPIAAVERQAPRAAGSAAAAADSLWGQLGDLATHPGFPAAQAVGSAHPSNSSSLGGPLRRLLASAATTSIPSEEYLVTDTSGSTVSVGYWYRTVGAVANISTLLIPDSDYASFQAGYQFSYYSDYSTVNTALGAEHACDYRCDGASAPGDRRRRLCPHHGVRAGRCLQRRVRGVVHQRRLVQ